MNSKVLVYILTFFIIASFVRANPTDSVGTISQNGTTYLIYKIEKETLYAISRKYGVSVQTLYDVNPELKAGVKAGQKIRIPCTVAVFTNQKTHIVEAGQTLFAISRLYQVQVDDLKRWNALIGNELKVGSKIFVSAPISASSASLPAPDPVGYPSTSSKSNTLSGVANKPLLEPDAAEGLQTEKGNVQLYVHAEGTTFYYALHRTAPVGTIVRVTNPTTEVSIYARVQGKLPESTDANVVLQLTKAGLDKLQTLEKGVYVVVEMLP